MKITMRIATSLLFWSKLNASADAFAPSPAINKGRCSNLATFPDLGNAAKPSSTHLPFVCPRGGGTRGDDDLSFSSTMTTTSLQSAASSSAAAAASSSTDSSSLVVSDANLQLLSERGRDAISKLVAFGPSQSHVYGNWPEPGTDDDGKQRLAEQLADLDASYPGGLAAYLTKAQSLLESSARGDNPFQDFEARVPEGESLSYDGQGTMDFAKAEQLGLEASANAVFVLVAGGLGERLGYSGIKLSLETNLCTNKCYLELYTRYIQAMQYRVRQRTGRDDVQIPLVLMTSGDTDAPTRALLEEHDYFGMDRSQVTIVTQDKVPALRDGNAGLALDDDDRWSVQTKPHGHGDVHHLLWREGLVDQWEEQGKGHVIFLQDTNALVINSVLPALGVSVARGFHMNSICIPRLAGEAAGAIASLEHKSDPNKSLVINVEYNQLDPLLRSQGDGKGDVADPDTGYSPYPGNANNLVLELGAYAKTLRGEDRGVVLEFVNPKYKDDTRTTFKKPTRLECMMQDIPKLFQKEMGAEAQIGFTLFDRWFTFSPAKNALDAGQADVAAKGRRKAAPGTMSSAESDKYIQNQRKLMHAGVKLPLSISTDTDDEDPDADHPDMTMMAGIPVTAGPRIILSPAFAITQEEVLQKIPNGADVSLTRRSSLVLEGHHLTIKSLELDGALVIRAGPDTHVTVDGLSVNNAGWELKELEDDKDYPETVSIRGYTMDKHDTAEYLLNEPGHFIIDETGDVRKVDES